MNDFMNTVDLVGDEALVDSIVDKSIVKIEDNTIANIGAFAFNSCSALETADFPMATSIGSGAFQGCSALTEVSFPVVTSIGTYAFELCSALETADFPMATSIGNSAFANCSKLKALILRSEQLATLSSVNALAKSAIKLGTGYIYVPGALIESYKSATNWSSYAKQFRAIEDYPEICDPYSWEALASHLDTGDYADFYSVGDVIPLDLGDEGVINMQIAAFNTDDLADGSGKASISFVAQNPLATARRMNLAYQSGVPGTGGIGGWDNSEMKSYLSTTLKNAIPEAVRSRIKAVTKTQESYGTDGYFKAQTSTEEIWLPSKEEVGETYGAYAALFPDRASRIIKRDGVATAWWTRSASSPERFYYYDATGDWQYGKTEEARDVIIGFCIG